MAELPHVGDPHPPQVQGITTGRLLGSGATGQVWSGVEHDTGRAVAVKVLPADGTGISATRREVQLLRRIVHPHVVRLLRVDRTADGATALVLEHAPGGSLAALVVARGPLDPGEVVTVLTPLAGALADLHARGVLHADVSPGNVLFAADGRPLLSDLGTGRILGAEVATSGTPGFADPALVLGGRPCPAGDVYGLGAVAWWALTGRVPQTPGQRPPLVAVAPDVPLGLASLVERCLGADPGGRPGAAELAAEVFGTVEAFPVRLVPTDPHAAAADVLTHRLRRSAAVPLDELVPLDEPVTAPRRRGRWLAAAGALGAVVVGGVLALGLADGTLGHGTATTRVLAAAPVSENAASGSAVSPATDPAGVVAELSSLRAEAFSTGRATALLVANVDGSAALRADEATLAALTEQEVLLRALEFEVVQAEVVLSDPDQVTVRAVVGTGAHQVVRRSDGEVLREVPASAPTAVTLVLTRSAGTWRVSEVR